MFVTTRNLRTNAMKTFSLLFLLILTPLILNTSSQSQTINGNGIVTQKTYQTGSFDKISVDGVINTELVQGDKESVTIETDDNLHTYLKPAVKDNTLSIEFSEGKTLSNATTMKMTITVKDLKSIELKGVGNLKTSGMLKLDKLSIESAGVGNIKLEVDLNYLNIDVSAVGNVKLKGKCKEAAIVINSVGNLTADELETEKMTLKCTGIGNAKVFVTEEIVPELSGSGNIICSGNPSVKGLVETGIGRFKLK